MTMPNAPLLRATLEHIQSTPEGWDQGRTASRGPRGTVRFGFEARAINLWRPNALWKWELDPGRIGWEHAYVVAVDPNGPGRHALHVAAEVLGLVDERHVFWLADPEATVAGLAELVAEILDRVPAGPVGARP